jgi:hypothetical protein
LQSFDSAVQTITFFDECGNYVGDGHKWGWYDGESPVSSSVRSFCSPHTDDDSHQDR